MNYFQQESERLTFRKVTESDISQWTHFFENNDRIIYLGLDPNKSKEELAELWISKQLERYKKDGYGLLVAQKKETKEFIGMAGILPRTMDGKEEYEIAYSLFREFWGNGYATEAAIQMKKYGFENIDTDRFISIIHIENTDSKKVAKKNGMHVLFQTEFKGMPVDIYGIEKK